LGKKKVINIYQHRPSFKDLIVTSPTVKTGPKSDKRFELQNILDFIFNVNDIHNFFSFLHACIRGVVGRWVWLSITSRKTVFSPGW
jgi:hypothetical protein